MPKEISKQDLQNYFSYKQLQAYNTEIRSKYNDISLRYNYLEKNQEKIIEKAVKDRTKELEDNYKEQLKDKEKEIDALKKEIAKLTSKLDNNSMNSSIPTSQTKIGTKKFIPNTREKTEKTKGGQLGHKKHKLKGFSESEATEIIEVSEKICPKCLSNKVVVEDDYSNKCETDYEVKVIKRMYKFKNCKCEKCGNHFHTSIPDNLKEENQYGPTLQSLAVCLTNEIYTPFNKTVKLISGITDSEINMSESYVAKLQKRASKLLEIFTKEVSDYIVNQPVYGWDDGVIDISTQNGILRVYNTDKVSLFKAHEKKDEDSLDDDGILLNTPSTTIVMHDHLLHNYNEKYAFENVECMIHLIRRLNKMKDKTKHEWCDDLKHLLSKTNKDRNNALKNNKDSFDIEYLNNLSISYDEIITKGWNENEDDSNNYFFDEEITFLKDLEKYKENYLLWAYRFDIPSTNNGCERSIRPVKSKMKISGTFQSITYAEYYANIRSYIETSKRNGINIIEACRRLMQGNPYTLEEMIKNSNNDN